MIGEIHTPLLIQLKLSDQLNVSGMADENYSYIPYCAVVYSD